MGNIPRWEISLVVKVKINICSGKIRKFQIVHALYHSDLGSHIICGIFKIGCKNANVNKLLIVKLKIERDVSMSPRQHFQVTK